MTIARRSTPKSVRTREAIETAAKELFSLNGFDRTTVRDIGARAGIDPSMIIRYFGGKEALFAHVALPDLQLPDLSQADPATIGETMVRHFLEQWEGEQAGGGMPVLLRSAASNEEAAERLRAMFRDQVFPAIARVGPSETAAMRAGLVASQILGLAMARYVLLLPPVVMMSQDVIVRTVGETVQRYATGATGL
ncbi:TetR/AcrR family transcriptional regulator [Sphingomonas mali]|uniref:TetR/AcrR family transcriptional regulator n=1 Tax=Sphingomonas mali TaxID=40682 RepID=UPI000835147C|nr:TetR family transcriptional regulator [Sphingomonas mali]